MSPRPPISERMRPYLRGARRIGPIRAIVPGDDLEVAREIARLWAELDLLRRGGTSGGGAVGSEWVYVGSGGTAPVFVTGGNSGPPWTPCRFRNVVISGKVEVEVEGVPTGISDGDTVWEMPAAFRPQYKQRMTNALALETGVCVTEILPDGPVKVYEV